MAKSQFAAQFGQFFLIHKAIQAAVSQSAESSGLIDPIEVAQLLMNAHPDMEMAPSELAEAITIAAADAGVRLANRPQVV